MESNLLQTFWKLSSIEEKERVEAAIELITLLEKRQVPIFCVAVLVVIIM